MAGQLDVVARWPRFLRDEDGAQKPETGSMVAIRPSPRPRRAGSFASTPRKRKPTRTAQKSRWPAAKNTRNEGTAAARWLLQFRDLNFCNILLASDLGDDFGRWHAVKVEKGQGGAARLISGKRHAGDIYLVFAHDRADPTYDTGPIFILHQEQHPLWHCFHG